MPPAFSILRRLAVAAMGVGIIVLSLLPGGDGVAMVPDKLKHVLAYGSWAFVAALSPRGLGRICLYLSVIFLAGICIEAVQPFFGRTGDMADALANGIGVFAGGAAGATAQQLAQLFKTVLRFTSGESRREAGRTGA